MPLYLVSQERGQPDKLMPRTILCKALEAGDAKQAVQLFCTGRALPRSDTVTVKNLATHEINVFGS